MRTRMTAMLGAIAVAGGLAACSDSTSPTDQATTSQASADQTAGALAFPRTTIQLLPPVLHPAFPAATGTATFRSRNHQRELQIEVQDIPQGTIVLFYLGGVQVGTQQTADALGAASIDLSTQLGDIIPGLGGGKTVKVKTNTGKVVVKGSF